jgi:excisionase family DNA binding protein
MIAGDRKHQIVQVALETIGEYGVQGATISRIAHGAGITPAALYSHFQNRRAILVAALEKVYEDIAESFAVSPDDSAAEQFDRIFENHAGKVLSQDKTSHAHLFLEFVASAPEEGLREVLREKELETNAYLASVVREQQRRGLLPWSVDAETIAWLIAGWAWTGNVANLMDVTATWNTKVSPLLLEFIRERVSFDEEVVADEPSAALPLLVAAAEWIEESSQNASLDASWCLLDGLPSGAVFTVEEVAEMLKVSAGIVSGMVREGQLRAVHLGAQIRVPRRALLAFLRGTREDAADISTEEGAAQPLQALSMG